MMERQKWSFTTLTKDEDGDYICGVVPDATTDYLCEMFQYQEDESDQIVLRLWDFPSGEDAGWKSLVMGRDLFLFGEAGGLKDLFWCDYDTEEDRDYKLKELCLAQKWSQENNAYLVVF